jgi:TPR repeat protein
VKWWRLAADQGLAQAQFNLGVIYAQGLGVVQDTGTSEMVPGRSRSRICKRAE